MLHFESLFLSESAFNQNGKTIENAPQALHAFQKSTFITDLVIDRTLFSKNFTKQVEVKI